VVKAQRERAKTLAEMAAASAFFYKTIEAYDPKDAAAHLKPEVHEPLTELRERLASLPQWSAEAIHAAVNGLAEARGLKLGKIAQPLRVAVAGRAVSPPIDVTLALLGREKTLQCLDRAIGYIRDGIPAS
jgi:glutamyl-tRNA synthetase